MIGWGLLLLVMLIIAAFVWYLAGTAIPPATTIEPATPGPAEDPGQPDNEIQGLHLLEEMPGTLQALELPETLTQPPPKPTNIDEFITGFHRQPDPLAAPAWLKRFAHELVRMSAPTEPGASLGIYFFVRIASLDDSVIGQYENVLEQLKDADAQRYVSTVIMLAKGADPRTVAIAVDDRFPIGLDVLKRDIVSAIDLDYLWVEFFITGNEAALERIIRVFEWPDLVRDILDSWLQTEVPQASLWQNISVRRRAGRLRKLAGISIDLKAQQIRTSSDLDCICLLTPDHQFRSPNDLRKIISVLPKPLSEEDITRIRIKAAAKWSIADNALVHPEVLSVYKHLARCLPERAWIVTGPPMESVAAGRVASDRMYIGAPLLETVKVRSLVLEAYVLVVVGVLYAAVGANWLLLVENLVMQNPIVFSVIASLALVIAILFGAMRQVSAFLLSRAGAIPCIDDHGRPQFVYVGDVPNRGWQRSPWNRAGTWCVVAAGSLIGATIAAIGLNHWMPEEFFAQSFLAVIGLRWIISSVPTHLVRQRQTNTS